MSSGSLLFDPPARCGITPPPRTPPPPEKESPPNSGLIRIPTPEPQIEDCSNKPSPATPARMPSPPMSPRTERRSSLTTLGGSKYAVLNQRTKATNSIFSRPDEDGFETVEWNDYL